MSTPTDLIVAPPSNVDPAEADAPVAAVAPTTKPLSSFSFRRHSSTPIAVSTDHAERGLRAFNDAQSEGSVSALGHNLRADGGIPSSQVFISERAQEDSRFAGLNLETRDPTMSLRQVVIPRIDAAMLMTPGSSQLKRDFRIAEASLPVPPGFGVGPSLAARPISRSVTLGSETEFGTTLPSSESEIPITLPNHIEVSKTLHLIGPPTVKAGQKEKPETAPTAAARANGNVTRLGALHIGLESKVDGNALAIANTIRRLETKVQNSGSGSDPRVGLLASQVANCVDTIDDIKHTVNAMRGSALFLPDGSAADYVAPSQLHDLYVAIKDQFHDVDIDLRGVHAAANPLQTKLVLLETKLGELLAQQQRAERDLLAVRESVARTQSDVARQAIAASAPPTPAPAPIAANAGRNKIPFEFGSLGNKRPTQKRRASIELVSGPAKRANTTGGRPDKTTFHHWIHISPLNRDVNITAISLFRKLIDVAIPKYTMPLVFVERTSFDLSTIAVGFASANEAYAFVGMWAGLSLGENLKGIKVAHANRAGSSTENNPISFLMGN